MSGGEGLAPSHHPRVRPRLDLSLVQVYNKHFNNQLITKWPRGVKYLSKSI